MIKKSRVIQHIVIILTTSSRNKNPKDQKYNIFKCTYFYDLSILNIKPTGLVYRGVAKSRWAALALTAHPPNQIQTNLATNQKTKPVA